MTALDAILSAPQSTRDHFWARVDVQADGCWNHQAAIDKSGYGRMFMRGYAHSTYRVAYIWTKGPVPEGLVLDHLCRNRRCVNPDHLEPVTQQENMARGKTAQRTHCKRGHEYTPENTRMITHTGGGPPYRQCQRCRQQYRREGYLRRTQQRVDLVIPAVNPVR